MRQQVRIDEQVTIAGQPEPSDLHEFARQGFQTVVNMRTSGEDEQPLSPEEEDLRVNELGMEYVHFPVSETAISAEQVDEFRKRLPKWLAPVLVHCKCGKRSGAFVMMDRAVRQGWTVQETLAKAETMGLVCDVPKLSNLIKSYVESRRS